MGSLSSPVYRIDLMRPIAIIPVRITPTAKRRLAHVLRPAQRVALVRRMFDHVCSVVVDAGLEAVALSPAPIEAAVPVWIDERPGLNAALRSALQRSGVPALIVHADLPSLTTDAIETLLAVGADVVVARSPDGGTNGLFMRRAMAPAFGVGSAHAHAARARNAGLSCRVVDIPGFARDIDDSPALTAYGASFLRPLP